MNTPVTMRETRAHVKNPWVELDGAAGEGGGQILRSALTLSILTGRPLRIDRIRAGRKKSGLLRQHLTAVNAAAAISGANVRGAEPGSLELRFEPGPVRGGERRFAVGTAGSATLVLQTVLLPLLLAAEPSELLLEGGTHNPFAPTFDCLDRVYLPLLRRMGARVEATLERPGFFPAGGGRFRVRIDPVPALVRLDLPERGAVRARRARALVSALPKNIADREIRVLVERFSLSRAEFRVDEVEAPVGPGNVVGFEIESEHVTERFVGFGEKGTPADEIATRVADAASEYLDANVPVGRHLADQLLLPLALAGGGSFRTLSPSSHTQTQIAVLRAFLRIGIDVAERAPGVFEIRVDR